MINFRILSISVCMLTLTACGGDQAAESVKENSSSGTVSSTKTKTILPSYTSALPSPSTGGVEPLDRCGISYDYKEVERYVEKLQVPTSFVSSHEKGTVILGWVNDTKIKQITGAADTGTVASVKYCSGSVISNKLVLTAAHCFEPIGPGIPNYVAGISPITPRKVAGSSSPSDYVDSATNAKAMYVQLDFQEKANNQYKVNDSGKQYMIKELVEFKLDDLDFAVVSIENPSDTLTTIDVGKKDFTLNDKAIIIQHPAGTPKKVDVGNITKFQGVAAMYNNIDTRGGSSGSGVLDKNGVLRAVHVSGGCQFGAGNWAVRIESILKHSKTLQSIAK